MSDFITLTCPNCKGRLQITEDLERFACMFCGTEHIVKRGGGIVSLTPVVEKLEKVQSGVERTASELAIRRLESEIKVLEQKLAEQDTVKDLQLSALESNYRQQKANLASPKPKLDISLPFYIRWFKNRSLLTSIGGGILIICLIYCLISIPLIILTVPDSSSSNNRINSEGPTSSTEDSSSPEYAAFTCVFCPSSILLLIYLAVFETKRYERKLRKIAQNQLLILEHQYEADRKRILVQRQPQHVAIEDEIIRKKRQLAEHRRIVD